MKRTEFYRRRVRFDGQHVVVERWRDSEGRTGLALLGQKPARDPELPEDAPDPKAPSIGQLLQGPDQEAVAREVVELLQAALDDPAV